MNLYSKLGFRFSEPLITLHWHPQGSGILVNKLHREMFPKGMGLTGVSFLDIC